MSVRLRRAFGLSVGSYLRGYFSQGKMLSFGQPCEIRFSFYLFRAPTLEGQGILVFAWGRGSRCSRRNCRIRSKVEYMSVREITGSCGCGVRIRPTIVSSPLRFPSNLCRQLIF